MRNRELWKMSIELLTSCQFIVEHRIDYRNIMLQVYTTETINCHINILYLTSFVHKRFVNFQQIKK